MSRKVTLLLLLVLTVEGCNVCGEERLTEATSPNNKYVATVFRRSCGATAGFLYHVNIRTFSTSFVSDYRGVNEDGQVFLTHEGRISISWKDDKTLQVSCDSCQKDPKPKIENSLGDVSISYELR
jgi:hypothetical protein